MSCDKRQRRCLPIAQEGEICHIQRMTKEADSKPLLDKIAEKRDHIVRLEREKEIAVIELRAYEDAAKMVFGENYQFMSIRSLIGGAGLTGAAIKAFPSEAGKSLQQVGGGLFGLLSKPITAKDLTIPVGPAPVGILDELSELGKLFVDKSTSGIASDEQPGKRKRRLSVMWAQILAALNSQPSFDYKDLLEVAEKLGHEVAPNVARSQMKLYADSGLVERIDDGKFRVTADGIDASARTLLRDDEAPDEAEAPESADD